MLTPSNNSERDSEQKLPPAGTGNASNPSPQDERVRPASNQLLNEKAEKYLRESANIEDEPDVQDQLEADETIKRESDNP